MIQYGPPTERPANNPNFLVALVTNNAMPSTLTVLICNYNHGRFIARAIEAVLTQSRPADEFIIIDDCSTDESVSVIRGWVERYPSIRFLQNERNLGIHASFQRGIEAATSDFLYGGAADDRVLPGFFEGAMRMAEQYPTTGLICGQFVSVDPSGRPLWTCKLTRVNQAEFLEPSRYLRDVLMVEPATHSLSAATIFRIRPLLDFGGIRADLSSWGDTFAIQVIGLRHGLCYWPHPAMEWTILPGSVSQSTRSDPMKALRIVDRAVELMRSDAYRALFPAKYVEQWAREYRQSIAHEQLSTIIEANQVLQAECRVVAESANWPTRTVLQLLQFAMRALYFVTFRVLRSVMAARLARRSADEKRGRNESH